METPEEFAENWMRYERGWSVKLFYNLGMVLVVVGIGIAVWQFYDEPGQLSVPFLLAGIGCFLFLLVACADGILVDLEYLQRMIKEGQTPNSDG